MYKGYRNLLLEKNETNNIVKTSPFINKCKKCNKLNPTLQSPARNNIQKCLFCGNPFYIIKENN